MDKQKLIDVCKVMLDKANCPISTQVLEMLTVKQLMAVIKENSPQHSMVSTDAVFVGDHTLV